MWGGPSCIYIFIHYNTHDYIQFIQSPVQYTLLKLTYRTKWPAGGEVDVGFSPVGLYLAAAWLNLFGWASVVGGGEIWQRASCPLLIIHVPCSRLPQSTLTCKANGGHARGGPCCRRWSNAGIKPGPFTLQQYGSIHWLPQEVKNSAKKSWCRILNCLLLLATLQHCVLEHVLAGHTCFDSLMMILAGHWDLLMHCPG